MSALQAAVPVALLRAVEVLCPVDGLSPVPTPAEEDAARTLSTYFDDSATELIAYTVRFTRCHTWRGVELTLSRKPRR